MSCPNNFPIFGRDLWADDVLADPYPTYWQRRDLGPVVWLETQQIVTFPRFAEVRSALSGGLALETSRSVGTAPPRSWPGP